MHNIPSFLSEYKDTENVVGVMKTRMPQLLITCPEYAHKIFVTEFRRFHDNEMSKFVSRRVKR